MGLGRTAAQFVAGLRASDVPKGADGIVALGFRDCIAVAFAGWDAGSTRIAMSLTQANETTTPLSARCVSAGDLGLVLGTAAHALDFDDTALSGHPSAVLVPAILAAARVHGADGEAMLAAYIAGYEIWAELVFRDPDPLHAKGWHPSATIGTLAAAAAVSRLRAFSADLTLNALGVAASMASGIVANFGTMTKPVQLGLAVRNGLLACDFAEAGLSAAADALEHDKGLLAALSPHGRADRTSDARLGLDWRILQHGLNVKLYPVCYSAHRAIDAARALKTAHNLDADAIAQVDVEIGLTQATTLRNAQPKNALDAKFSAEFAMAAAFIAGGCGLAEVSDQFVAREAVQQFMTRVRIRPIDERSPEEPAHSPFDRVSVILRDGRRLVSPQIAFPRGHFRNPAPDSEVRAKFKGCVGAMLDGAAADRLFDRLHDIAALRGVDDLIATSEECRS